MESQNAKLVKNSIHHKLRLFRELGRNGGLGGDRVWVLLDKSTKKTQNSCVPHVTLPELLDIEVSDLVFVYGKIWKGYFSNGELSHGFHTHDWKNGVFISVSDGAPTGSGNVPKHGVVIDIGSEDEIKLKENFRQKERDSQQSASPDTSVRAVTEPTPSPLSTTPSSTSRTSPPSTASSSRPALPSTTPSTRSAPASTTPLPRASDPTSDPVFVQWARRQHIHIIK